MRQDLGLCVVALGMVVSHKARMLRLTTPPQPTTESTSYARLELQQQPNTAFLVLGCTPDEDLMLVFALGIRAIRDGCREPSTGY